MSDTSIIKEFLVALGFKVDAGGMKKFEEGVSRAGKFVTEFATGVEAMAVTVEAAVVKVSAQFEDLYYASQRMNDSVENIRGATFAIGQLGGTAHGAMEALENLGEFFRSNPGGERFVQGLGVETRTANGELRGMTQIMGDLAGRLRAMPYYRAKVVAGVLGIDPRTLQALLRDTGEAEAKYHAMAQRMGIDQDAAAKASHDFMNDLRELLALVTLAADKIVLAIQPMSDRLVRGLEALHVATGGWSTALIAVGAVIAPLLLIVDPLVLAVGALGTAIALLWNDFQKWKGGASSLIDWGQWSDQIDAATAGFGQLVDGLKDIWSAIQPLVLALVGLGETIWQVLGPAIIPTIAAVFKLFVDGLHLIADVIRLVIDLFTGNWAKAWQDNRRIGLDMIGAIGDGLHGLVSIAEAVVRGIQRAWYSLHHHGETMPEVDVAPSGPTAQARQRALAHAGPAPATPPAPGRPLPAGIRNNNPGNLRSWGSTPTAGGFARFATAQDGLTAMAKNLIAYAGRGVDTVKAIISKWAPSSENNTGAYIADVAKQVGVGADQRLSLHDPAVLKALMNAMILHENGQNPYGAGLVSQAASSALGRPVSVSQSTTITVHGADSPSATARAVVGEQSRVNGEMVRNLKTAAS